ncbi:hypothetical protein KFU94_35255 [Chloroflexi bacterium TSY]|nr:hypothetical protein [Chloroflexi bacterium TSY]
MKNEQPVATPSGIWQEWGDGGISKSEFDAFLAAKAARQANAPIVGHPAPDFEIERLDTHGKQTGQMSRLSSAFDKPVALVFGSYT